MLGVGPYPLDSEVDPDLINAGKETISELAGSCYFSSADSFGMIRGGHVDLTVLGALQVDENGTLANWAVPGKIVKTCSLPLTGVEGVNYIVTELAVIEVTPEGLVFREIAEDTTVEQVQALTEPRLLLTAGGPQKMLA